MSMRTVGIDEASSIMGISKEALRKRILRGSIDAKKDDAGYWRITLNDTGQDTGKDTHGHDTRALIEHLQRENDNLWQELYRKDTIIMNLTESVKLLGPGRQDSRNFFSKLFGGRGERSKQTSIS